MIPVDGFALEDGGDDDGEDDERDSLLNDLELHQRIGTAINLGAYTVGWNHEGIFEQSHSPAHEDDEDQRPVFDRRMQLLELEVAIPGEGHEDIRNDQKNDCQ